MRFALFAVFVLFGVNFVSGFRLRKRDRRNTGQAVEQVGDVAARDQIVDADAVVATYEEEESLEDASSDVVSDQEASDELAQAEIGNATDEGDDALEDATIDDESDDEAGDEEVDNADDEAGDEDVDDADDETGDEKFDDAEEVDDVTASLLNENSSLEVDEDLSGEQIGKKRPGEHGSHGAHGSHGEHGSHGDRNKNHRRHEKKRRQRRSAAKRHGKRNKAMLLAAASEQQCEKQLSNKACEGQFHEQRCKTCQQWIDEKVKTGMSKDDAKKEIGNKFISQCGACAGNCEENIDEHGYTVVFKDDFNGNSLNRSNWEVVRQNDGGGNNELQAYVDNPETVYVKNGVLTIKAIKKHADGKPYSSGKLTSRKSWKYGLFAGRLRLRGGTARGTWPAFWMMPRHSNYGNWPNSGEMDIMEHVGHDKNKVHGTFHTECCYHKKNTQVTGNVHVNVDEWHEYSLKWTESEAVVFMDGKPIVKYKKKLPVKHDQWPFDTPFYLILNMAVGGDWGGQKGIDENAFVHGQQMEVDWVKVSVKK